MPLSSTLELFGEVAIAPGEPPVMRNVDCVYAPFSAEVFFDRDPSWGIYSPGGSIIPAAAYVRGEKLGLIGQSQSRIFALDSLQNKNEEYLYFGPLIPHYGHFVVSSLARAWFASHPEFYEVPLLCHSDQEIKDHFQGYMGSLTSALDLDPQRFVRFKEPVRFTNLTIPSPAFLEQKLAYEAFLDPMHRIGDSLLRGRCREPNTRPIWLSKSRIGANAVAHVSNENEIEELLVEYGFDIISPECLSLSDQIDIFNSRSHVLGFVGSAFHTHVFTRRPPQITCITLDRHINTNLLLIDRLNNVASKYFYPEDNIENINIVGYSTARRIKNPRKFVADPVDVAEISSRPAGSTIKLGRQTRENTFMNYNENCARDHSGENYHSTLVKLHQELQPETYLEIGTLTGATLALSQSSSIAIDPKFQVSTEVIGSKKSCLFFQMESDLFFEKHDPVKLLGKTIDLSFLDGMHHCEFLLRDFINAERNASPNGVIALHDCIPVEIPMTDRTQNGTPPVAPHRGGWWTGDVWRTLLAIKRHRTDLKILCLDAAPTGLVLISRLDPSSNLLREKYDSIVDEMMEMDLEKQTVAGLLREIELISTSTFERQGSLSAALRAL